MLTWSPRPARAVLVQQETGQTNVVVVNGNTKNLTSTFIQPTSQIVTNAENLPRSPRNFVYNFCTCNAVAEAVVER